MKRYTVHLIAGLVAVTGRADDDTTRRILAGARAVAAVTDEDEEHHAALDALRAALVAHPGTAHDEAFALAGRPALWGPLVRTAMFARDDITEGDIPPLLRGARTKTARRDCAAVVRAVALADALLDTGDFATLLQLVVNPHLPGRQRGLAAAEAFGDSGSTRRLVELREAAQLLPLDGAKALLEAIDSPLSRLSVMAWDGLLTGAEAWESPPATSSPTPRASAGPCGSPWGLRWWSC